MEKFGNTSIEHTLVHQLEISHRQLNELVDKNTKIWKSFIDIYFLGSTFWNLEVMTKQEFLQIEEKFYSRIWLFLKTIYSSLAFLHNSKSNPEWYNFRCCNHYYKKNQTGDWWSAVHCYCSGRNHNITIFNKFAIVIRCVKTDGSVKEWFLVFKNVSENRRTNTLYH